jgi:hypothetical protein
MEKLMLKNGQEVNLEVQYIKLFEFQNKYKQAKDLIQVVTAKEAPDTETIMQIIYVAYLGGGNETNYEYAEFLNLLKFDFKRDMKLFANLVGNKEEKN